MQIFKPLALASLLLAGLPATAAPHSERHNIFGGITHQHLFFQHSSSEAKAIGGTVNFPLTSFGAGNLLSLDSFFSRTYEAALDRNGFKADVNNAAFLLALRSNQRLYGIAKAGLFLTNMSYSGTLLNNKTAKAGVSLGAGWELFNSVDVEVDYSLAEQDLRIARISLIFSD